MARRKISKLFSSTLNTLDKNTIVSILEFLDLYELNNLASLCFHSGSEEIENEFYNQTLLNIKFGKCLLIYSWNDWLWIKFIGEQVIRINTILERSNTFERINCLSNEEGNYRKRFIKEIWKRIDSQHWTQFQNKRKERISYISSISNKITEIAKINLLYKNEKCENLIRKRINEQIFFEESSIKTPLREELRLDLNSANAQHHNFLKWVSIGNTGVGKTCLLIRFGYNTFPEEYTPTIFESYASNFSLPYLDRHGAEFSSICRCELWDTAGHEDFDEMRPLSYLGTTLFTMEYSVGDWSSLKYLAEHLMWECTFCAQNATFVVVSTKNDLIENLYWNSLFDPKTDEPISKEEGIAFAKSIGAATFIETSAKNGMGTVDMEKRLALIRHTHLHYLENNQIRKKKPCNLQ